MSEQVLRNNNMTMQRSKIRTVAQIGMLAGVSTVLMLFEFPIPFIAPPFYEMDFSEVPVLIGAFAMGPIAGAIIELVKILLNFVINGTLTAGVGELANFIMGCAFVMPAAMIYKKSKSKKHAITGMAVGTVTMALVGCVMNALVLLPAYGAAFGMPVSAFVDMGKSIHASINGVWSFVFLAVAPFNLLKGVMVSLIVLLLYKRIRVILRGE